MKDAEKLIAFVESLKVPTGPLAGQKIVLAEYQKRFIRGCSDPANMIGVLSIARGNAKTCLGAALALAHLCGKWMPTPQREILLAAKNRDQAKVAFRYLVGLSQSLPKSERDQITTRHGYKLELDFKGRGGGEARCIPADGASILGTSPTLALLDERAAWPAEKGDDLENAILSGLGKRNGKCLILSTAGDNDANSFSRWCDEDLDGTYRQVHEPSEQGLPADDAPSLLEANPGASEGIGPSLEWLQAQARRAIARGGSALSSFRNLNRNERVSIESRSVVLTVDQWLTCESESLPPADGPCVLGVDLGGSVSMSAAAFYWPETGRLECVATLPSEPSLADRGQSDGVKSAYVEMARAGELNTLGGKVVPAAKWLRQVLALRPDAQIQSIIGDRFRLSEFQEAMANADCRLPFISRGMGFKDGSEDVERFRSAAYDGHVQTAPSLLLRHAFGGAVVVVDPAQNCKLAKGRSRARIDAAAATILAVAEGRRRVAVKAKKSRVVWA
ncbi:terminase large subunit domain-containing protein [Tateyamaria sp. SN3-11]|uniref:terminase large subunit domain-containing protein n=1 Tax=Tateyamaria sp. SN3-11 TaxID=3092147 RepID=UPI0039E82E85